MHIQKTLWINWIIHQTVPGTLDFHKVYLIHIPEICTILLDVWPLGLHLKESNAKWCWHKKNWSLRQIVIILFTAIFFNRICKNWVCRKCKVWKHIWSRTEVLWKEITTHKNHQEQRESSHWLLNICSTGTLSFAWHLLYQWYTRFFFQINHAWQILAIHNKVIVHSRFFL